MLSIFIMLDWNYSYLHNTVIGNGRKNISDSPYLQEAQKYFLLIQPNSPSWVAIFKI